MLPEAASSDSSARRPAAPTTALRTIAAPDAPASAATGGTSLTAANEDVFVLQPASLGATTSGSFPPGLFFDGSLYGLANNALWGLDVPV